MATLRELVDYANTLLDIGRFQDYCPNGLQVEGRPEVGNDGMGLAHYAMLEPELDAPALTELIRRTLGRAPLHIPGTREAIRSLGWCTGAAQSYLEAAAGRGWMPLSVGKSRNRPCMSRANAGYTTSRPVITRRNALGCRRWGIIWRNALRYGTAIST
jgi:hypothetical protein